MGAKMVQFVKTHFPERQGAAPFHACMAVLLVRNPFDAMESYFNLMMTGTHTATITDEVRKKTAKVFEEYVLREIRVWIAFHNFWMKQDIPILLVRYEDLIRKPDKAMARVLQFVLEIKHMGTFFTERVDRCIKEQAEIERMGSYKPRSGGIGKSLAKYPPELFQKLKSNEQLKQMMTHLGYKDLLEKPVEEWSSLEPLVNYATEYQPTWHNLGANRKVVLVNRGNLARTTNEQTHWMQIKKNLGNEKDEAEANSSGKDEGVGEQEEKLANCEDKVEGEQRVVGENSANDHGEKDSEQVQGSGENKTNDQDEKGGEQGENNTNGSGEGGENEGVTEEVSGKQGNHTGEISSNVQGEGGV